MHFGDEKIYLKIDPQNGNFRFGDVFPIEKGFAGVSAGYKSLNAADTFRETGVSAVNRTNGLRVTQPFKFVIY